MTTPKKFLNAQAEPVSASSRRTLPFPVGIAVLAFLALIAAACGQNSDEFLTETPPSGVDVEYGATLDEWVAAAERPIVPHGSESFDTGLGADGAEAAESAPAQQEFDPAFADLEWDDLVPEGFSSGEIWDKYEEEFALVEFGTPEELALYEKVQAEIDPDVIEPALDGQKIRMNGFVAPLTYDEDIVTEFLLVPYFGACIHVPAPPSNQTVMVKVDKENGLTTDEAWGAVWVEGTMSVEAATTDIGVSSYAITGGKSGVYEGF